MRPLNRLSMISRISTILILLLLIPAFGVQARASVILDFSDFSSDETPVSALDAFVQFSVSAGQLFVGINNTSSYSIAQLYFNTDTTLTGLAFNASGATNSAWSVTGTGASQTLGADGMGRYNWLINFGSGSNRLASGSLMNLVFDMTGTTSEATIGSKLSINPPGKVMALAVIKFEAGPNDDSAFGGTTTTRVPEPSSALLLGAGLVALIRSRRTAKS